MNELVGTSVKKAVELLNSGEVVAIPTETVYGLAASIHHPKAIDFIFELKGRPRTNPLIVHVANFQQVEDLCVVFPEQLKKLATKFWPGSLTLVLPKSDQVNDQITAGKNTVGIRIPNHPLLLKVLEKTNPLAAPSANPFERISPTTALHVADYFPAGLKMVLDGGACERGIESTIVGLENDEIVIYRLGAISIEEIESIVGKVSFVNTEKSKVVTPGMSKKHYAPQTKTIVTKKIQEFVNQNKEAKIGLIKFSESSKLNVHAARILSLTGDLKQAAKTIYKTLHEFDQLNLDFIVVEPFPNYGIGKSVNERLSRAVHQ